MSAQAEFYPLNVAVLTVSDTRSTLNDTSGDKLCELAANAGHAIYERTLIKDDVYQMRAVVSKWIADRDVQVILITGGTGFAGRDSTPEAIHPLLDKEINGFGELFRWLSYKSIGTSTVQSRACAIVARGTYLFALPGSNGAVKDGWDGILAEQLDSRNRPCNFVELMPRLTEK